MHRREHHVIQRPPRGWPTSGSARSRLARHLREVAARVPTWSPCAPTRCDAQRWAQLPDLPRLAGGRSCHAWWSARRGQTCCGTAARLPTGGCMRRHIMTGVPMVTMPTAAQGCCRCCGRWWCAETGVACPSATAAVQGPCWPAMQLRQIHDTEAPSYRALHAPQCNAIADGGRCHPLIKKAQSRTRTKLVLFATQHPGSPRRCKLQQTVNHTRT